MTIHEVVIASTCSFVRLRATLLNQYTFEVYAGFADGSHSPTNRLIFSYAPALVPLEPRICSIRVTDGVLHLTLTNLTAGVTNRVERSLDLAQTNGWSVMTNFVSTAITVEISEGANPSWGRAFYRVFSTP